MVKRGEVVVIVSLLLLAIVSVSLISQNGNITSYAIQGHYSGLVAWYKFNGNVNDSSGNNYNGINKTGNVPLIYGVMSGPSEHPQIVSRYSVSFDGVNDHVLLNKTYSGLKVFSDNWTFSTWIMPEQNQNAIKPLIFVGVWHKPSIVFLNNTNNIKLRFTNNSGNFTECVQSRVNSVMPGQWTHVIITNNNGNYTIYINGNPSASKVCGKINTASVSSYNIGGSGINSSDYFKGGLDEMRIYNRLLSSSEITELYNEPYSSTTIRNYRQLYFKCENGYEYNSSADSSYNGDDKCWTLNSLKSFAKHNCTAVNSSVNFGNSSKFYPSVSCEMSSTVVIVSDECREEGDDGFDIYTKGNASIGTNYDADSCVNETTLREFWCNETDGLRDWTEVRCENGCIPEAQGACRRNASDINGSNTRCNDSDNGINYYEKGTITLAGTTIPMEDQCDETNPNLLRENYCLPEGWLNQTTYLCPGGCNDGACSLSGLNCEPFIANGKKLSAKTRVQNNSGIYYCDPLTLTYKRVKQNNSSCIADYECRSNVCIEGNCVALRTELGEQRSLIVRIWCALANPVDFLKRNDSGESASNNDYLSCVSGGGE